jgi:enoyl-CoA hydratase
LLERTVGRSVALELLLTGRPIEAERAHLLGLVSRVVPAGEARAAAWELAESISRKSPLALLWSKRVLNQAPDLPDRSRWEEECFEQVWGSEDWQEGIEALLAKRPPVFAGLPAESPRRKAE